ncbi:hypothetical protein NKJ40_28760 [Mesorhizobium sp. M0119]|uniref:hypothetical protein n=1 Tax=unclassified Mesorhizobium TaxID=325217 RepID=UPI003338E7E4
MTIEIAVTMIGVVSAAASAFFWFWSARIPPSYPMAYLSGPPDKIVKQMDLQAKLNAWAATMAGIAVLCQGILIAIGQIRT